MTLAEHTFPVHTLAFGPDGTTLTSAAFYTEGRETGVEVTVWDVGTGHPVAKRSAYPGAVLALAFAPGGQRLAAAQEEALVVWDVSPWHERRMEGTRSRTCALALSDDGCQLADADFANNVTLWEVASGRLRACCKGERVGFPVSLAFSPDGRTLASGSGDGTVRLWDTATGQERAVLRGHAAPIHAVAFSADGRTVASGDFHGAVKLWDVASGAEKTTLPMSEAAVPALAFAPDGRTLAVAVDRAVQVWDVGTGRLVSCLEGHQGKVKCLAYSPDGVRLASGSYDRTVRLWNAARYRP
jgi:WD40 repeat protein